MCNCLKKSNEKVSAFLKEKLEQDGVKVASYDVDSGYVNRGLVFGKDGYKLFLPFELKYTPIKKDGTHGREATKKTNVFPTFCPFCGKKMDN